MLLQANEKGEIKKVLNKTSDVAWYCTHMVYNDRLQYIMTCCASETCSFHQNSPVHVYISPIVMPQSRGAAMRLNYIQQRAAATYAIVHNSESCFDGLLYVFTFFLVVSSGCVHRI